MVKQSNAKKILEMEDFLLVSVGIRHDPRIMLRRIDDMQTCIFAHILFKVICICQTFDMPSFNLESDFQYPYC